jgi:hypothetical protein
MDSVIRDYKQALRGEGKHASKLDGVKVTRYAMAR